ncbi:transmembrane protein, putative (macronuclear) [Tetrahymena thermophila SB210]|uniref:Transmembrane protein, putative n=1 Tax=Tetrahymena thermophila (strain SB210) TaxID=312017 RepID=A4VCT8_TETTS|nr:transmembrane protein, putative [Tetrahymena thermophila SB210]EDK31341.1 transmembrane protein, putative [Tetrahymena thermophila SB210]|eukprot:XP_001471463.1 transmembrane protein, putative [Tetrahymena thermophila SB210]
MDSFFDGTFDRGIFTFEILYSISAIVMVYLAYIYINQSLLACFIIVMICFGLKRILSAILCIFFQESKSKGLALWMFDALLLGFVFGLVDIEQFSGMQTFYVFFTTLKIIGIFLTQMITFFCFKLLSDDNLNEYIKIVGYVLFLYCLIIFSCSISWISGSKFKFKFMLNIINYYISLTCLTLFEKPQGNNMAYYQLLIIIISMIIIYIKEKSQFLNVFVYIFLNGISEELDFEFYHIYDQIQFKYFILLRYLSEVIRFGLILFFGFNYIIDLSFDNQTAAEKIKLTHILMSMIISIVFFIANYNNFLLFFKVKKYLISTEKDIQKVAEKLKMQTFKNLIIIDFKIQQKNKDQIYQYLINQSYIQLFQKISEIKLAYGQSVNLEIRTNYNFTAYFTKEQDLLIEILKSIEYIELNTFFDLVRQNKIFEIVQGRIQYGFIQNKFTQNIISKIQNQHQRVLVEKLLVQNLIITSFYKNLSQSQNFSSQQILYDLYED